MDSLKKANQQKEIPHRSEGFQAAFLSIQPGAGYGSRTRLTCLGSTGTTDVLTLQIKGLEPIITDAGEKIKSFLNEIEKRFRKGRGPPREKRRAANSKESIGNVGQKCDLPGPLDGLGKLTLMHSAGTGCSAGQDFCAFRDKAAQLSSVLVIDMLALFSAELAYLPALTPTGASGSGFTIKSHKAPPYKKQKKVGNVLGRKGPENQKGSSPSSSVIS